MRSFIIHFVPMFVLLVLINVNTLAQKGLDKGREGKLNIGKYHFSTAWTWDFSNEFEDRKGEMKVYVDTLTGTFLFTKEAYGNSDMEADFVIAGQDGIYLTGYTDANGKKSIQVDTLEAITSTAEAKQFYDEDFEKHVKLTGEKKIFGTNSKKWPVITGEEYKFTFEPPTSFSLDYLAKQKFSLLPVYYFNQRQQAQAKLPYSFSGALHMNYLLLENTYESDGKKITIVLRNVMPENKTIDLTPYIK